MLGVWQPTTLKFEEIVERGIKLQASEIRRVVEISRIYCPSECCYGKACRSGAKPSKAPFGLLSHYIRSFRRSFNACFPFIVREVVPSIDKHISIQLFSENLTSNFSAPFVDEFSVHATCVSPRDPNGHHYLTCLNHGEARR
jgi:hypothetical protein